MGSPFFAPVAAAAVRVNESEVQRARSRQQASKRACERERGGVRAGPPKTGDHRKGRGVEVEGVGLELQFFTNDSPITMSTA